MAPHLHILTIFPEFFEGPLGISLLGKAIRDERVHISCRNIRDKATDKHGTVDDTPYGGGSGMIMAPGPIVDSLESIDAEFGTQAHRISLTPSGTPLSQNHLKRWKSLEHIAIVCGRYEGIDARVGDHFVNEEISLGDFVLFGGEVAALAIIEGIVRLIPGVVGNEASVEEESFSEDLLEYPQYTRPRVYRGHEVPEILLGGNHGAVRTWRQEQAKARTERYRADLLPSEALTVTSTDKNT